MMTLKPFHIPFEGHTLVGDIASYGEASPIFILHGAGKSNRNRFRPIREDFWAQGIASVAFDLIGHGNTGGELRRSSLISRTQQACAVIDALSLPQPLGILAASMGAYTAVKLLDYYPVDRLVLMVPAMYAAEAYTAPFDQGFTEIIRYPHSWLTSDAWEILKRYTGQLLIVAAEHDRVIPDEVIRLIEASAIKASSCRLYTAPNTSHNIITDLRGSQSEHLKVVLDLIIETLRPKTSK